MLKAHCILSIVLVTPTHLAGCVDLCRTRTSLSACCFASSPRPEKGKDPFNLCKWTEFYSIAVTYAGGSHINKPLRNIFIKFYVCLFLSAGGGAPVVVVDFPFPSV